MLRILFQRAHLKLDFDFTIDLSLLPQGKFGEYKQGLVNLAKIVEPKWLTSDVKEVFDYEVRTMPGGLRLTKLASKGKKP